MKLNYFNQNGCLLKLKTHCCYILALYYIPYVAVSDIQSYFKTPVCGSLLSHKTIHPNLVSSSEITFLISVQIFYESTMINYLS